MQKVNVGLSCWGAAGAKTGRVRSTKSGESDVNIRE